MSNEVSINTHEPVRIEIPNEEATLGHDRPDVPAPHLWSYGVVCVHRKSKRKAVVHKVDLNTRQFRAYYPDTAQFDGRTAWQSFDEWDVEVTLSPKEVERQVAEARFAAELLTLDAIELSSVVALCDDEDPAKRMAKLTALRHLGIVKAKPEASTPIIDPKKDVKR